MAYCEVHMRHSRWEKFSYCLDPYFDLNRRLNKKYVENMLKCVYSKIHLKFIINQGTVYSRVQRNITENYWNLISLYPGFIIIIS